MEQASHVLVYRQVTFEEDKNSESLTSKMTIKSSEVSLSCKAQLRDIPSFDR